jgi:cellulose synthase/poly-beta-1,6-N-acetylglucosamine synthase-like glycosyltransferase
MFTVALPFIPLFLFHVHRLLFHVHRFFTFPVPCPPFLYHFFTISLPFRVRFLCLFRVHRFVTVVLPFLLPRRSHFQLITKMVKTCSQRLCVTLSIYIERDVHIYIYIYILHCIADCTGGTMVYVVRNWSHPKLRPVA